MMFNLLIGDFILVNKFFYGLCLLLNNVKIVLLGEFKCGDVVVFYFLGYFDVDLVKGENFIKCVIGVLGDEVVFQGDGLIFNGELVKYDNKGIYVGYFGQGDGSMLLVEYLLGCIYIVLEIDYLCGQGQWIVLVGKYLVMGDNCDNSDDGCFWGLLLEENFCGKVFLIWLNCLGWFCKDGFELLWIGLIIN